VPDEYYELWFGHEGGRVCAGTFVVDNRGRGEFSASCPEVAGGYQRGGITLEVPKASLSHLTTLEGGLLRLGLEYLYLVSCFSRSGTWRRPC
jgi:hypothetical protein